MIDLVNVFIMLKCKNVIMLKSQMTLLRLLTFILGSLTLTLTVQLFWIYFYLPMLVMAFPPLGNSHHVVVSVSIDSPSHSKRDSLFHHIAYDYSHANWDGLRDNLRDVPWEDTFKLGASADARQFCD